MTLKQLLVVTAFSALAACTKKDDHITTPKVDYIVECATCTAKMDVRIGERTVEVKGAWRLSEINELKVINILTTGSGKITVKVRVDGEEIYNATNTQSADIPVTHTIKR